ncbi:MAG: putative non-ribosomal peptide synthetase, partial [Myxococcaceae bacterium]|nr:putative non-ribosomal peptide synthetase [Myxococcaceae bacterium]
SLEIREHGWYPLPDIQACSDVPRGTPLFDTIVVFENYPLDRAMFQENSELQLQDVRLMESTTFPIALYALPGETLRLRFNYLTSVDRRFVVQLAAELAHLLDQMASNPEVAVGHLEVLQPFEARQIASWNDTAAPVESIAIHALIEARARETPDTIALAFRARTMTFHELDRAADRVAGALRARGVGTDDLVGVCFHRSLEMVIALLGVLKAGAAYLPLDPTYPAQRISYVLSDAHTSLVLTERSLLPRLQGAAPSVLDIEGLLAEHESADRTAAAGDSSTRPAAHPDQLAYVIYTSGSSGKPKGVAVTHRNVTNFFVGMDRALGRGEKRVWLALTSISFDISVLELLWTLSVGDTVVVQEADYVVPAARQSAPQRAKPLDFSLFYFANESGTSSARSRYHLLTEGARFADANGFSAVWTPERHFHSFGGLYPNPSVTSAALATITKRIALRAGSVVLPLHHPVRVAEEWSVVDNLSGGRVGLSFAAGWNDNDFALAPSHFADRREHMLTGMNTVRALWRGEEITLRSGTGKDVRIALHPPPVQPELPVWLTAAGNPETFTMAGELGANLLTHLLGQSPSELKAKIALYREARRRHGHPGNGQVTLMLHTYVGKSQREARESVSDPLRRYLRSSTELVGRLAGAAGVSSELTPATMDRIVDHAFGRYYEESGLLGPIEACLHTVQRIQEMDVDEVGCLIDFGVPEESALEGLQRLAELRDAANAPAVSVEDYSLASQLVRYGVTHLQCTPSHASALLLDRRTVDAMRSLHGLLIGGEKLPTPLARALSSELSETALYNMYGPTETTIWSSTHKVDELDERIPVGRPIANTELHVLDSALKPVPAGGVGDLYIGGMGLARAYRGRAALTAERFLPDPFATVPGRRMYTTGDRALRRRDGTIEVLGRADDQVKIRGHRVEPGEIEDALRRHPAIHEAAVIARPREGVYELAAFWVSRGIDTAESELRSFLREQLPEYMIPSAFFALDVLPKTPNGKIDRGALTAPEGHQVVRAKVVVARDPLEFELVGMWEETLDVRPVGVTDNFFELGGHSFTALRLMGRLQNRFGKESVSIATLLQTPTIEGVANFLRSVSDYTAASGLVRAPAERHEPFALTDLQHAYWLGEREHFDLGRITAHAYEELDFPTLDVARFQAALDKLIHRHDGLRTVVVDGGQQRVLESVPPYPLRIVDLSDADDATIEARRIEERGRMVEHGPQTDVWPPFEYCIHLHRNGAARLHLSMSLMFMDGLSTTVMVREMMMLYTEPTLELPPLHVTFRDYTRTLAALEGEESYQRAAAYWRARVPSLPPCPELPLARPPSSMLRQDMQRHAGKLGPAAWASLKKRAAAAALTPNSVLCAAYSAVLACWSKDPHFTLNLLMGDRRRLHPEVDQVLGNFSSTLLLEVAPAAPGESFVSWTTRVQAQLWSDLEHRAFSGLRVLGELNRAQGQLGRAGMPVVFASTLGLNVDHMPLPAGGTQTVYGSLQTPQVWIDLNLFERGGELLFNWDVAEPLFPDGMVDAMFDAYCDLLARLAEDDAAWSEPLGTLAPEPQRAALAAVNQTEYAVSESLLQELFETQAHARPEALAIIDPTHVLTYGELAQRAYAAAAQLQARGAASGDLVAVVMEKGWEQVVAVLGVLFAGCAYLPIDPGLPRERLHRLLELSGAQCALLQTHLSTLVLPDDVTCIFIDAQPVMPPHRYTRSRARPEDLAYIIYTSGSTGDPKGVMIDHRGAVNTVLDINRRFAIGPDDRVLALSALNFDLSVWDVFGVLAAGGAIVIPGAEELRDPARWADRLQDAQVTVWNSVPALMTLLVDYLDQEPERALPSLRLALLSGDWIPVALPARARGRLPGISLISLGGATEASIWSIAFPIQEVDPTWTSIPYGTPLANQGFQVLDACQQPRPVWAIGDLYITGLGVAQGYFRDEARTRASFDEDPATGVRRYRTGDLGRYLPDGNIEFLGRSDLQVKIQGYRVELGEIEAALGTHPSVQACAVIAVGELRGAKRLAAFIVPSAEPALIHTLRDHLRAKLPEYMVPTSFASLETIPLSVNGKVDRAALAKLVTSAARKHRHEAARDPIELALVKIWQDVLSQPSIGVLDNFFDLGGQSVVAVSLMARIERHFGRRLPLGVLLEAPTIEQLASLLRREHAGGVRSPLVPIQRLGEAPPLFLIHPVGGNVLCYVPLAHSIDNRPVYALQSPGLDGERAPHATIESMATDYLRAIREVQGSGPYLLGGWSLGGVVAYEMARQLRAEGERTALVVMFDSSTPRHQPMQERHDDGELAAQFLSDLAQSFGKTIEVAAASLSQLEPSARLDRMFELASAENLVPEGSGRERIGQLYEVFRSNMLALLRYKVGPYDGPVILARAADVPGRERDLGWSTAGAADLTVHDIPGDHYAMITASKVADLSKLLETFLPAIAQACS